MSLARGFVKVLGVPVVTVVLYMVLSPEIHRMSGHLKNVVEGGGAVLSIALVISYIILLISSRDELSDEFVYSYPVILLVGTFCCFYMFVPGFGVILDAVFAIGNLAIASLPVWAAKTQREPDEDSDYETPRKTKTTVFTNEKGRKTEYTTRYYSGNRKEVDKKRLD